MPSCGFWWKAEPNCHFRSILKIPEIYFPGPPSHPELMGTESRLYQSEAPAPDFEPGALCKEIKTKGNSGWRQQCCISWVPEPHGSSAIALSNVRSVSSATYSWVLDDGVSSDSHKQIWAVILIMTPGCVAYKPSFPSPSLPRASVGYPISFFSFRIIILLFISLLSLLRYNCILHYINFRYTT